jgi:glycosyltransferase involved in cell wall biosynthesis
MRIAQIAPLIESVPPRLYGGTERIVSYLTEELVKQGHDVTLFASADSLTSAKFSRSLCFPRNPQPPIPVA